MILLSGIVSDITFQNEDSGFTVLSLQKDSTKICCVGTLPTIACGESVLFHGEWSTHKKFGKQFLVQTYEIVRPTTLEGISMLLGSGLISNIGPIRAKKIIDTFGLNTLDILDNQPERLLEVQGIGQKFFEKIKEAWEKQKHLRKLMIFLQGYGVTLNLIMRIYKTYGTAAQIKISENPYSLVEDVWGIGFIKADQIAQKMGFSHDSYKRVRAGLLFSLQEAALNGHSYLLIDDLIDKVTNLLNIKHELATYSLDHALEIKLLYRDDKSIYLPAYYFAERFVAESISKRLIISKEKSSLQHPFINQWLDNYQMKSNWTADLKQKEAVRCAVSHTTMLLTGGPGTGKTTTLQIIVSYFKEQNRKILLAAPTGRAAQRMGTVANLNAHTIHRLLEFKPSENGFIFLKDGHNPLDADVIILDEVSMIDLLLMKQFLSAVKLSTTLIFVGDNNQLPSVGAGNILADFISCGNIPHVHLSTVFRQAAESRIIQSAYEIIRGTPPKYVNLKTDDCFMINREDPQACIDSVLEIVSQRLPNTYGFDPINDIQVISPMHKGILGTDNLNVLLQKSLNQNSRKIVRGQNCFYCGDKVMQIKNNYDTGVFNGDIGNIIEISDDNVLVNFDNKKIYYELSDLDEISPAYCISIHKSQGCEFKAVVILISTQHYIMLQRNLIYTALTRAKKLCVLIGTQKALNIAVKNDTALNRNSMLSHLIKRAF